MFPLEVMCTYLKERDVQNRAACQALQNRNRQQVTTRVRRQVLRHQNAESDAERRHQGENHHVDDHETRRRAPRQKLQTHAEGDDELVG